MKSFKILRQGSISKHLTGMLMIIAMTVCMVFPSFAASGQISFSDPTAVTGTEVNVTMKISADEGTAISDANVVLSYDSEKLEFIAGTDADGGAGTIRVHGVSNGGGTANLEYNLRFNAKAAGTAAINISTQEVYDSADQLIQMSHLGNSSVNISAQAEASANADLASLNVSPGSLSESFSPEVTSYSVSVGPSVDTLVIDAPPADGGANVIISGNEGLQMGDNTITVRVTAADGVTSKDYILNVSKVEGGAEAPEGEGESTAETMAEPSTEGVKLSSTGKTITIMTPGSDVQVPEGFKAGTISVDGHKVQGWVWGADTDPQYCVVYGMNENGELNFYRYDIAEKTIQRYFEDPLAVGSVSGAQYTELQQTYDSLVRDYDLRFVLICVLAILALIFLAVIIYLALKLRNSSDGDKNSRKSTSVKERSKSRGRAKRYSEEYDEDAEEDADLSHDYSYSDEDLSEEEGPVPDETQVIEPVRKVTDREKKTAEAPSKPKEGSDIFDDEFDTFDI